MYEDACFPNHLVDKGKHILIELCFNIEAEKPKMLETLYTLTHKATDKFNDLQEAFEVNESEVETVARECIAMDVETIAKAYHFDADAEALIARRAW